MLNRKLVEYTDISSKYVKVGVRYCVYCCFCCLFFDFYLTSSSFFLLSVFMYAFPGLSQVPQPALPLQWWGVDLGELGTITQTYLSSFLKFHKKPLQTHNSSYLHVFFIRQPVLILRSTNVNILSCPPVTG